METDNLHAIIIAIIAAMTAVAVATTAAAS